MSDQSKQQLLNKKSGGNFMMMDCFQEKDERPHSLPNNWPHPTDQDLQDNPKRLIQIGKEVQEYQFSSNFVKTSKYTPLNFLPKFLLEEFDPKTKIANCYFLLVSMLQCVPYISNTGGYPTTLIPLTFVVFVDGVFQVLEDLSRHRADQEANSTIANVWEKSSKSFVQRQWANIQVGDYLRINSRDQIPADVIIVGCSEKTEQAQGLCFVETKSLDGETNLKIKQTMPQTIGKVVEQTNFNEWSGNIEMEHPNKVIASFTGIIDLSGPNVTGREVINSNNVLLRGCVLRNTDWVMGLVVNSGHDTKIMMSNTETKPKSSALEVRASSEISKIIIMLFLVCFIGATGQSIWNYDNTVRDFWYLQCPSSTSGDSTTTCTGFASWIIQFFYLLLLHASFIPVSLYVSMSMARFFQAYFMNKDIDMYYERLDCTALVRTMTLNEELGQISHIFSDKTGTLTCNIMDFRKFSVRGISYGLGITEIGKASMKLRGISIPEEVLEGDRKARENSVDHVSFYCPTYERDLAQPGSKKDYIQSFMRALAICHDVIPERIDGKIKLSASNPDDEALVCAAKYFGFSFTDRRDTITLIENREAKKVEEVETLVSIEFSSKRKRMSVIVRDTDKKIRMYSKGADTMMLPRIKSGQDDIVKKTMLHMDQYSEEGLRCLLIGNCDIEESFYNSWYAEYKVATTSMVELEKKKKGQPNKIEDLEDKIERDLTLLGCTAIEDRLQDGVPECIEKLVAADLNIWVLTGDKQETAINIAVACNLIQPPAFMDQIIISEREATNQAEYRALFKKHLEKFEVDKNKFEADNNPKKEKVKPRALVIDGPSLIHVMKDRDPDGCKSMLLEMSKLCKAVVGCRVSPDQKREMVALIKEGVPGVRTLAIGDGANDVAMIQEAHIGVGIRGEEGLQAVNSSDYAIAQFRYLQTLVLKHGRYNYIRMTYLICFMFYKNILLSMGHFWMNFIDGWSGSKYYTEGAIQMFNLLYSAWPILFLGIYDTDLDIKSIYKYPRIYSATMNNEYFTTSVFWGWVFTGVCESIFLAIVPIYMLIGIEDSFFEPGALCFTAIVLVVNIKIYFIQSRFHWVHHAMIAFTILLWIASAFFINYIIFFDWNWFKLFNHMMVNNAFWLTLILVVVTVTCKDLLYCSILRWYFPSPYHILQEAETLGVNGRKMSIAAKGGSMSHSVELADRSKAFNADNTENQDL